MDSSAILESYGWRRGNPLRNGAISKPILTARKSNLLGIGAEEKHGNAWWNELFDQGIKNFGKEKVIQPSLEMAVQQKQTVSQQHSATLYRFFVKGEGLQGTIKDTARELRQHGKEKRAQGRAQRAEKRQNYKIAYKTLQKYVLLAKSLKHKAAADLIHQATSDPECFVFKELLDCPNITALEDGEFQPDFHMLQVFSWGNLKDIDQEIVSSPKVEAPTIDTCHSLFPSSLPYAQLGSNLEITSQSELEDLIISAIYASLLSAKLDSKKQFLRVSSTFGRDLSPTDPSRILNVLKTWDNQCSIVLSHIGTRVEHMRNEARMRDKAEEDYDKEIEVIKADLKNTKGERRDIGDTGLAVKVEKKRRVTRGARKL